LLRKLQEEAEEEEEEEGEEEEAERRGLDEVCISHILLFEK
jgi:hypothetical protein